MEDNSALNQIELTKGDRVLILAPHPDDETIATGGIVQRALAIGLPVRVVWLTYGDNNETSFVAYRGRPTVKAKDVRGMGLVRHEEAMAAAGVLGLTPDQLTFLGYPDFRTLVIWSQHWGDVEACESMFTRTRVVPYANAFRPGTPYKADEILADLETVLRDFRPTVVFVSHPGDHNPDHQSLYLFTRVALWNLADEMQPTLHPYLVHHPEWPQPEGYHPEIALLPPDRLASATAWLRNSLSAEIAERKHRALTQHASQYKFDKTYLDSFIRANELFGDLPPVPLRHGGDQVAQMSEPADSAGGVPVADQLTHAEQAKFVGIERRGLWQENGNVVVSVSYSGKLGNKAGLSISCFGYRADRAFRDMPKLRINLGAVRSGVFDQQQRLAKSSVETVREPGRITVQIPLELLGSPQYILGSARSFLGKVPLDWIAWRVIEVPQQAG
jgi:LmbE family N-acetylglucosaminyl deacetylase